MEMNIIQAEANAALPPVTNNICRLRKCVRPDCKYKTYADDKICSRCKAKMPHKCNKDGCEIMSKTEFCRKHSRKYNQCAYEGCNNKCYKVYCHNHTPAKLEYYRIYHTNRRELMRRAAMVQ